jgi:HD-like signal output (HDOD) protein
MNAKHADILNLVEKMPAFPQAVTRVLDLASRAECSPKDLVRVVEQDPVMTMKILKLVNSAYFGLSRPINSISHGVIFIGINTIKNLALTIAAMGMLPSRNDAGMDMDQFLLHSLGVAAVAKRLSNYLGVPERDGSDYFISGLLHDFGKVVLAQFKAKDFAQALQLAADGERPLYLCEQEVLGMDHAQIGGMLAESWKLPQPLALSIRYHHLDTDLPDNRLRDVVFAANQLVHGAGIGASGNRCQQALLPGIQARLGMDMEGLRQQLGDIEAEMDKARAFIS